jgi:hypothetical protein
MRINKHDINIRQRKIKEYYKKWEWIFHNEKELIDQEEIKFLNMYISSNRTYKHMTQANKEEIDKSRFRFVNLCIIGWTM